MKYQKTKLYYDMNQRILSCNFNLYIKKKKETKLQKTNFFVL